MTSVEMMSERDLKDDYLDLDRPALGAGIPIVVTLVDAPACHLCGDAKSTLAVLAQSYSIVLDVLPIGSERGRRLMNRHRSPMSPLVLLDGQYFSAGRLPRSKLERRLTEAQGIDASW
jgi:hypothetical protein